MIIFNVTINKEDIGKVYTDQHNQLQVQQWVELKVEKK